MPDDEEFKPEPVPHPEWWNQCDGCRRRLPIWKATHYEKGHPIMGCTKGRYSNA